MANSERRTEGDLPSLASLRRKEVLLRTINEFALKLLSIPDKTGLVWYVAREVVGRLGFDDCVIYLTDREKTLLRQAAAIGAKNPRSDEIINPLEIPIGQGITGHVAQTKQALIVDDLSKDDRYIPDVEPALSEICVPLIIDDEVVGVIDSEDPRPGYFGDEHLEILTTVAAMTSAKLQTIEEARRAQQRTEELRRLNEQLRAENLERQRAEMAVLEREGQFTLAFQISRLGYWSANPENTELKISAEMANILGVPLEEVDGISNQAYCERFVHPKDQGHYSKLMDMPMDSPWRFDIEYRLLRGDGTLRWVREIGESLLSDKGEILCEIGTIQDITEIRNQEDAVRTREAWLRAIFENSPLQLVLKDTDGRIMMMSRNVLDYLGITAEDGVGTTTADYLPSETAEIYMAADRKVVDSGLPIQQEVCEEHDGELQHFLNAKFPLMDNDGQIIGVCSMTTDITEEKQAEARLAQAQKMEAVGQLTGGVAHDFNNLLAVIHGNAEMLSEDPHCDADLTRPIMRAAARGAELTQRLLAFSRQQPLHPRVIDLGELVSGMSEMLVRTLGETVEIKTSAEPGLWAVLADPGQVENAILNLALNARDAMPRGGRLTIECANSRLDDDYVAENPEAKAGDYVALAVSDQGVGMSAEVRAHAFEPFYTTKGVGTGSGLGLSMVYGFAKQSGGHVSIYSEEGQGTTIRLSLPRARDAVSPEEPRGKSEVPQGRGELVLVIEDNPDVRALAVRMLKDLGYRAVDVADAAAAHQALAEGEPVAVVLSDVVLPGGVSGPDFAKAARLSHPGLIVIFMSGYAPQAAKGNGVLGADEVLLNKPFRRQQLAKVLRDALESGVADSPDEAKPRQAETLH